MNSDLHTYQQLRETPDLFHQLSETADSSLKTQKQLRETYSPELVRLALTMAELRGRAKSKFSKADQMWFDRTGFEQSTMETVARWKAKRFANTQLPVLDLCSGIGMDAIAIAGHTLVAGVDQNELMCTLANWNADVYGVSQRVQFRVGDATKELLDDALVHIDPDRRAGAQRAIRLEDYRPDLDFLEALPERAIGGAIKLSPASNFGGKFPGCEVELISWQGECKEATVWFGKLQSDQPCRATLLPSEYSLAGDPWMARAPITGLDSYLHDPDPAIVRSGLLDVYAEEFGLSRLDDAEEYLTSHERIDHPGISSFRVLADLPNNDKTIRKYFRDANFGQVEIKCRHVPVDAQKVRKKLTLNGAGAGVLIFARLQGKTRAVIAERIS